MSGALAIGYNWVVRRIMSDATKDRNRIVLDLAREFLDAVKDRKDWHPFAQLGARGKKSPPNIPAFQTFKVLMTGNPGKGRDPDQMRYIRLEITMGGTQQTKLQVVPARMLAVREVGWEPCSKCDGEGHTEAEEVCSKCRGKGKVDIVPPRIPTRGTETYDHDNENAVWGICPTSFQFAKGERRLVKR